VSGPVLKASSPRAHKSRDVVGRSVEAANAVVVFVGNEHVAVAVDREAHRAVELGPCSWPVLKPASPRARERRDVVGRSVEAADAVVAVFGNEHVAVAVDRKTTRVVKLGRARGTVLKTSSPRARKRRDVVGRRVEAAKAVVVAVGNEHVAVAVDREAARVAELGRARGAVLKASSTRPRERRHVSRRGVVAAEAVVTLLGEDHRPVGERGDAPRTVQSGCGCGPSAEPFCATPHKGRHCRGSTCTHRQPSIHGDKVGATCVLRKRGRGPEGVGGVGLGRRQQRAAGVSVMHTTMLSE
jgi:hypothetical protein